MSSKRNRSVISQKQYLHRINWDAVMKEPSEEIRNLLFTKSELTMARISILFPSWFTPKPQVIPVPASILVWRARQAAIELGETVDLVPARHELYANRIDIAIMEVGIPEFASIEVDRPKYTQRTSEQLEEISVLQQIKGQKTKLGKMKVTYKDTECFVTFLSLPGKNSCCARRIRNTPKSSDCLILVETKYINPDA